MQEPPVWAIIVHLLGAAVFLGASFGSLVVVMRGELDVAAVAKLRRFESVAMYAVILQILIGGYLFSREAANFGKSPVFAVKMLALIAAGALSGLAAKKLKAAQAGATRVDDPKVAQSIKNLVVATFAALAIVILGFALAATA
jgi:hypothetical protein